MSNYQMQMSCPWVLVLRSPRRALKAPPAPWQRLPFGRVRSPFPRQHGRAQARAEYPNIPLLREVELPPKRESALDLISSMFNVIVFSL